MPAPAPDMSLANAVTIDDVRAAAGRIEDKVRYTPVLEGTPIDAMLDRQLAGGLSGYGPKVAFKCENLQHTGAFKLRGATNALLQLDKSTSGVLTYSSGNHAQAIARAGADLGVPTVIVMPTNAPQIKLEATKREIRRGQERGYERSRIVLYDAQTQVRETVGGTIARDEGLTIVPPYDHPHVIAGQGTAALELLDHAGPLDMILTPCGGGGLLSGSAIAAKAINPSCRVIGVEPAAADDAARSFRSGVLHSVRNPDTIADGTRTPSLGRYTFPPVLEHVDRFVTVEEDEIIAAMRLVMERLKLVVEPSGALGLAGLLRLAHEEPGSVAGRRIGIILSGGNVDLDTLPGLA